MMRRIRQNIRYSGNKMLCTGYLLQIRSSFSKFTFPEILVIKILGIGFPECSDKFNRILGSVASVMMVAHRGISIAGAVRLKQRRTQAVEGVMHVFGVSE